MPVLVMPVIGHCSNVPSHTDRCGRAQMVAREPRNVVKSDQQQRMRGSWQ